MKLKDGDFFFQSLSNSCENEGENQSKQDQMKHTNILDYTTKYGEQLTRRDQMEWRSERPSNLGLKLHICC